MSQTTNRRSLSGCADWPWSLHNGKDPDHAAQLRAYQGSEVQWNRYVQLIIMQSIFRSARIAGATEWGTGLRSLFRDTRSDGRGGRLSGGCWSANGVQVVLACPFGVS